MLMRVGIVANPNKVKDENVIKALFDILTNSGYEPVCFKDNSTIDNVDVLIVLGGDGAILHAAVITAQRGVKVVGINYGNLGFLAEYERDETEKVVELLQKVQDGTCHILKRNVLELEVGNQKYYALNEVSLQRDFAMYSGKDGQILRLETELAGEKTELAGDGVLICTPTGSTAYSLSAGGAILYPDVPVFMITPICALSLHSRPVVYSDKKDLIATVKQGKALVIVDGQVVDVLNAGECVKVKKAPFTADFPMFDKSVFLQKIRNKLNK
jgi:NAD+ kinase